MIAEKQRAYPEIDFIALPTSKVWSNYKVARVLFTNPVPNRSLAEGVMPSSLKCGAVTSLPKKAGMDEEDTRSYRSISNLPFLSKNRIRINDLYDRCQSVYRKHHSTETALIKVHGDISDSLAKGCIAALILLDLSAAFDVIDLRCSDFTFGSEHEALSWMKSYLSDRIKHILIAGCKSADSQ